MRQKSPTANIIYLIQNFHYNLMQFIPLLQTTIVFSLELLFFERVFHCQGKNW